MSWVASSVERKDQGIRTSGRVLRGVLVAATVAGMALGGQALAAPGRATQDSGGEVMSGTSLADMGLMRGWEQQRALSRWVGEQAWTADGREEKLTLEDGTTLRVQVFGVWRESDRTFSWAWATAPKDLPLDAYDQSMNARHRGGLYGMTELTRGSSVLERDDALAMTIMAAGMLPYVHGIFLAPAPFGAVLLAVTDFRLDLAEPTLASVADAIAGAVESGLLDDHAAAVRTYLSDRGFEVRGEGATWVAVAPGRGSLRLSFDPTGRLVGMECLGTGAAACRYDEARLAAAGAREARLASETLVATATSGGRPDDVGREAGPQASKLLGARLDDREEEIPDDMVCDGGPCPATTRSFWWKFYWVQR